MGSYLANSDDFTAVADAIRAARGTSEKLVWPDDFISAISALAGGGGGVTTYTVTSSLMYVTSTIPSAVVNAGDSFTATLTANDGYKLDVVTVTMGGEDITATAYANGVVTITEVTGDVIITATAAAIPEYKNIAWCSTAYTVGSTTTPYNGWIPHNLQYDEVNDKFLLLGCHRAGHTGAYSNISLHELDAEDPTKQTEMNVPTYAAMGCLLVDNGVWYIYSRLANVRYKSMDLGVTWVEEALTVETATATDPCWFGMFKINGVYFGCTDGYWNTYFKSNDGLNWVECAFAGDNTDQSTESIGKEGGIAYFNGFYYAFLRSDTIQHARVYKSQTAESGSWVLVDEETIPSYQSCPMPIVYKDRIACVTANRGDGHLYYCFLGANDDIEVNDMGLRSINSSQFGDFITANIAYDGEHAIIAYCTMSSFDNASTTNYKHCEVVALYGTVGSENNIPTVTTSLKNVNGGTNDAIADLIGLGVTIYPDGAELADASVQSTVDNTNAFDVYAILSPEWISKRYMNNETTPQASIYAYPVKDGKVALPAAQWGAFNAPTETFRKNLNYSYAYWLEINGTLYLYCNRQGQDTLLRRESFAYGVMPDGYPMTDVFTRAYRFPAGETNCGVLRNVNYIETVARA